VIALGERGPRTIPPRARVTVFDNLLCKAGIQVDVQPLTCPHPRGRRQEQGVHSPVSRRRMRQVVADLPAVVAPPSSVRSRTTRSSKARVRSPLYAPSPPHSLTPHPPQLLSDPTENTQQLTQQLRALGLYAADTLGDGNCLFRALSDQLYGTPSHHLRLRQDICGWIAAHKSRYEPFVEDERGFDVHLQCMRQQGPPTFQPQPVAQTHFSSQELTEDISNSPPLPILHDAM